MITLCRMHYRMHYRFIMHAWISLDSHSHENALHMRIIMQIMHSHETSHWILIEFSLIILIEFSWEFSLNSHWILTIIAAHSHGNENLHWILIEWESSWSWLCNTREMHHLMHFSRNSSLQLTATHCSILSHAATRCNTLQHAATRCNTLQYARNASLAFSRKMHYLNAWNWNTIATHSLNSHWMRIIMIIILIEFSWQFSLNSHWIPTIIATHSHDHENFHWILIEWE